MGGVGLCYICGEPCPPRKRGSKPRKLCDKPECRLAQLRLAGQERQRRLRETRRTLKSKVCSVCQREKPLKPGYWDVKKRDDDGNVLYWRSHCRACERAELRDRYATSPDWQLAARTKAAVRRAAERARAEADPEFREQLRAKWREYKRAYRAQPRKPRPVPGAAVRLPVGPFRRWLMQQREKYDTTREMAVVLGIDDSLAGKILDGDKTYVLSDTVDKALCREGSTHIRELYPELYPDDELEAAA